LNGSTVGEDTSKCGDSSVDDIRAEIQGFMIPFQHYKLTFLERNYLRWRQKRKRTKQTKKQHIPLDFSDFDQEPEFQFPGSSDASIWDFPASGAAVSSFVNHPSSDQLIYGGLQDSYTGWEWDEKSAVWKDEWESTSAPPKKSLLRKIISRPIFQSASNTAIASDSRDNETGADNDDADEADSEDIYFDAQEELPKWTEPDLEDEFIPDDRAITFRVRQSFADVATMLAMDFLFDDKLIERIVYSCFPPGEVISVSDGVVELFDIDAFYYTRPEAYNLKLTSKGLELSLGSFDMDSHISFRFHYKRFLRKFLGVKRLSTEGRVLSGKLDLNLQGIELSVIIEPFVYETNDREGKERQALAFHARNPKVKFKMYRFTGSPWFNNFLVKMANSIIEAIQHFVVNRIAVIISHFIPAISHDILAKALRHTLSRVDGVLATRQDLNLRDNIRFTNLSFLLRPGISQFSVDVQVENVPSTALSHQEFHDIFHSPPPSRFNTGTGSGPYDQIFYYDPTEDGDSGELAADKKPPTPSAFRQCVGKACSAVKTTWQKVKAKTQSAWQRIKQWISRPFRRHKQQHQQ
jgi:hypothetical protein